MQVTQFKFVEMLTQITAARELTNLCVRKRVAGEDATKEISMAKLFSGRMARYVADTCIQLHGGFGYMKESPAGRAVVDTRLVSIGGGGDEVVILYLAKMLGFSALTPRGVRVGLLPSLPALAGSVARCDSYWSQTRARTPPSSPATTRAPSRAADCSAPTACTRPPGSAAARLSRWSSTFTVWGRTACSKKASRA